MDHFDEPQKAIDWAIELLGKAWDEVVKYLQAGGFAFVVEIDAETGDEVRKFRQEMPLPKSVEGYLRNALVDLKHSFDQSLFAAATTLGKKRFNALYPWADTPDGVRGILTKRQAKENTSLPQALIDEIWRQQPFASGAGYSGGNDLIREIAKITNNKHSIGFRAAAAITAARIPMVVMRAPKEGRTEAFLPWDPEKNEMIISRMSGQGGSISDYEPHVLVEVFLEADGKLGKIPIQEIVKMFARRAQAVLDGFKQASAKGE